MANTIVVQHLALEPEGGLQVGFYDHTQDVKANGVMHMHTICIPAGDQYDDEIAAVVEAITHLVRDVLEDLPNLPALSP